MTKNDTSFSKGNKKADGEAIAQNNTKRRIMTDALMVALNREVTDAALNDGKPTKRIAQIAEKLVKKAGDDGDTTAIKEIFDRTEGKAAQAILHQGDPDNPVVNKIIMEIVG